MTRGLRICAVLCTLAVMMPAVSIAQTTEREVADTLALLRNGRPAQIPREDWDALRLLFIAGLGEEGVQNAAAVAFLRASLNDASPEIAVAAAGALLKVDRTASEAAAVAAIGAALRGANVEAHSAALDALETMNPLSVGAQVIALDYVQGSGPYRWKAARALRNVAPEHIGVTVPVLTKTLADPDWEVAGFAAETLGTFGMQARAASEALRQMLGGSNRQNALAAARALQHIDDPRDPALRSIFINAILTDDTSGRGQLFRTRDDRVALDGLEAIRPPLGQPVVPALVVLLTRGDDTVKVRAADLLASMGPVAAAAVPELQKLAGANAWESRAAADALRKIAPPDDPPPARQAFDLDAVIQQLKSSDAEVRKAALWEIDSHRAVAKPATDALLALLKHPHLPTRYYAAYVLSAVDISRAAPALPILKQMLYSTVEMNGTSPRMLGPSGLGRFGREGADVMVAALADTDPETRIAAAQGLMDSAAFPPAAVPALLAATRTGSDPVARHQAWMALVIRKPPAAQMINPLIEALRDPDVSIRLAAADGLSAYGKDAARALDPLKRATADPDRQVRTTAAASITEIDPAAGLPFLQILIDEISLTPEQRQTEFFDLTLLTAAVGLANLGPQARPALPALIRAWERDNGFAKLDLGAALLRIDPTFADRVVPTFVEAITNGHVDDRHRALLMVARVGAPAAGAREAVEKYVNDPDEFIRTAAQAALKALTAR